MPDAPSIFVGVMSGTSLDGIDLVAADFEQGVPHIHASASIPWPEPLRARLLEVTAPGWRGGWDVMGALHAELGSCYADACARLLNDPALAGRRPRAIGLHGQTVHHAPHAPHPFSLQLGDASRVAERCGIPVVYDFRSRDVAAGGEGAPLVPAAHRAFFHSHDEDRAVLNLGGIANLTLLPASGAVRGFDTGPGNTLLDRWICHQLDQPFDADGHWARSGRAHPALLSRLLQDPYFAAPPPKSTGTEYFNLEWLLPQLPPGMAAADVQATLAALTVETVAQALERSMPGCRRLLVCGGGARNSLLMEALRARLPATGVESTGQHGLPPTLVEATAFAWLAARTLAGEPGNLPEVTGAHHPVVLGSILPA
ncbi:MAG: anhydro-N-acetylmuramic acid kinase [Gammaproteobacteria bacterium]|nr:MAG: anhydro-N-acetylmuramic acid kinase [Gammaproteobacteria bacterium]